MPPAPPPPRQGCIRREGTSEAAPEAGNQAVGGGCQSGWVRVLSVTNAIDAVRETVAGHRQGALEGGSPHSNASLRPPPPCSAMPVMHGFLIRHRLLMSD